MHEESYKLSWRSDEFSRTSLAAQGRHLDRSIDPNKLTAWVDSEIDDAMRQLDEAESLEDSNAILAAEHRLDALQLIRDAIARGEDPLTVLSERIAYLRVIGDPDAAEDLLAYQARLMEALSDPTMYRAASEYSGARPAPSTTTRRLPRGATPRGAVSMGCLRPGGPVRASALHAPASHRRR